jgi:predicted DNA binding CopG/RHH family protein
MNEEKIKNIDQEIESISTQINDLATRQQRLLGYRQCLVDMKENKNNATSKNTRSS